MTVELTKKKTPRKASVAPDDGTDVLSDMAQQAACGESFCIARVRAARAGGPRSAQPHRRDETSNRTQWGAREVCLRC